MSERDPDFVYKIVFLGDSAVGKTSLIQRYVYDSLSSDFGSTIGAVLHVKMLELDGQLYKLVVWDIGGQQSFSQLREQYCVNASGSFFVFDRTRPETLEHIDDWINALRKSTENAIVIAVENKIDLESVITSDQIKGMLQARKLIHIQTSATEDMNVDVAFRELVKKIRKSRE